MIEFKTINTTDNLMDIFLLPDADITESKVNTKKLLTIEFKGTDSLGQLNAYHKAFTETAPYQYFGLSFSIAKNYHTLKKYTVNGEEDLEGQKILLLKYFISDGSFIFIRSNTETNTFNILISINGETDQELQMKSSEMEKTLKDFIETISI